MTAATGSTTTNGQSIAMTFGNGVTATYTQTGTFNSPGGCSAGVAHAAGTTGILAGTNVTTYLEPNPPAGSVSVYQCMQGSLGVARSVSHTFGFNKPIIGPVLHMVNLDSTQYDVAATTIAGGATTLTQLAKNNAMELGGSVATRRFNNTTQLAINDGCMLDLGTNPSGACGSFRFGGGSIQSWTTSTIIPGNLTSGDAWQWSVSFQTARLTKAFDATTISTGGVSTLTFTIDNTNATNGTNAATAAALSPLDFTDSFPTGITLANTTTGGTCTGATLQDAAGGTLNAGDTGVMITGFSVPANATCTLTVNVTASAAGTYTNNTSNMTSTVGNLVLAPNATLTVTPVSDLSITKTNATPFNPLAPNDVAGDTVTRGTITTYTIVATNNGPDAVTGATVRDPAEAGLTCNDPVPCTGSGCPSPTVSLSSLQSTGGLVLGTIPNGGTVTFTLSCTVQ